MARRIRVLHVDDEPDFAELAKTYLERERDRLSVETASSPTEDRDRVFETGFSTQPDETGFGLSIVERIAEAHGWDVAVTESDSVGARFEFAAVDRPA